MLIFIYLFIYFQLQLTDAMSNRARNDHDQSALLSAVNSVVHHVARNNWEMSTVERTHVEAAALTISEGPRKF